ncbi:MAG: (p)ppGpp synthetase, partial [Treponema sp.]|nr:(p)ppGpp synthetase [Treponema sp.]
VVCEIQIRTILQDAWAEVEHELIYKSEFNPFDKPLRRKLAAINANLGLADTIFQEIRDYQNKLQAELGYRRDTFYDKADNFTDKALGLSTGTVDENKFASNNIDIEQCSIDDLVLAALHEHNCGNFEEALKIYTQIINTEPRLPDVMLAVILKHRGMAYFAQNNYKNALLDFHESSVLDQNAFRSMYYEGIVYSVLQDDKKAIDCFKRSLQANQFQSHVYYRKAVSEYNLGMYTESMADLNKAFDLGLNDSDSKAFRSKLLKKFDMGF